MCSFYAEETVGHAPDLLPIALAVARGAEFENTRVDLLLHVGHTTGIIDCGVFLSTYLDGADVAGEIAQYARAIELARTVPLAAFPRRDALIAHSQYWTAVNPSRLGKRREASEMCTAALATFEAAGDTQGTALTLSNLAVTVLDQGRTREAIEYAERALAFRGSQAACRHVVTLVVLADAYMWSGDTAAAATTIERIVTTVPDGGLTPDFRCLVIMLRGTLAQQRGNLSEARVILQHACLLARERDPVETPEALAMKETTCVRCLAEVEHAAGRDEDAEALATVAVAMSRLQDSKGGTVHCMLILAEVTADDELAERILDAVQAWLHYDEANILLGQAALRRAIMAMRRGQHPVAQRQAEKALLHFGDWKDTRRIELARSIIEDNASSSIVSGNYMALIAHSVVAE